MSLIEEVLPESNILLDIDVCNRKKIFEQVAVFLEQQTSLSREAIFDGLFAREKLGSTGLGQGVAIPHGRYSKINKIVGVFLRLKEAIDYGALDNKPVNLVFVILVPESATNEYLDLLSHLADKFSNKEVREVLLSAQTATQIRSVLL